MSLLPRSIAKTFSSLNLDVAMNRFLEGFVYRNGKSKAMGDYWLSCRRFQILIYHKVSPETHPFFEAIPPAVFDQQMEFLSSCYRVFDLYELAERCRIGDIPERAVAVTFDDGYRDNYLYAFPILRKYKIPASIFIATGALGNRQILWHDRVFDAFRFATVDRARLKSLGDFEVVSGPGPLAKQNIESFLEQVKDLPGTVRLQVVRELEETLCPKPPQEYRVDMLAESEIREMHQSGISFGSHTVSHPILSRIEYDQLKQELAESKRQLEDLLRVPVTAFAYPNGRPKDYQGEAKSELRRTGYRFAVTTQTGFNTANQDLFELKRGQPWQSDIALFRLRFFLQRHGILN